MEFPPCQDYIGMYHCYMPVAIGSAFLHSAEEVGHTRDMLYRRQSIPLRSTTNDLRMR